MCSKLSSGNLAESRLQNLLALQAFGGQKLRFKLLRLPTRTEYLQIDPKCNQPGYIQELCSSDEVVAKVAADNKKASQFVATAV